MPEYQNPRGAWKADLQAQLSRLYHFVKRPDPVGEVGVGCSFTGLLAPKNPSPPDLQTPYTGVWVGDDRVGRLRQQGPSDR